MTSSSYFALALPLLMLAGCSPVPPAAKVATRTAADPFPGGTVVVPTPRICLDVQLDNVRSRRAGQKGLVRTQAVDAELRRALQVTAPRSREEIERGCAGRIDSSNPRSALDEARASSDVMAKMERAGAKRAIVTEIATRLVCPRARVPSFEQLGGCFEDDVSVSAIVFDESGRSLHVAEIGVDDVAEAEPQVRSLLGTFRYRAPGSAAVQGACRLVSDSLLDCTERPQ